MGTYYQIKEEEDRVTLEKFATESNIFRVFPTEEHTTIDAHFDSVVGKGIIEMKDRGYPSSAFNGEWFLEVDKYAEVMRHSVSGGTPLVINFFTDGIVAIWNLHRFIPREPVRRRTWNEGMGAYECSDKYILPLSAATIYNKEGKKMKLK